MSTLVFDTETTGFVLDKEKPSHPSQPHLVELGCVLYDDDQIERVTVNVIIKPDGWTVPDKAAEVHKITTDVAERHGIPLVVALALFSHLAKSASRHVGHNVQFDLKVMMAAFHRAGKTFPTINPLCTKEMAEPILKIPPTERMKNTGYGHKFKAPNLTECVRFLFDEDLVGAHSALTDARACGRVLFELEKRGLES